MEFVRANRVSFRFVLAAAALLAGEATGFLGREYAPLWPWAAAALALFVPVAIGWSLRRTAMPLLFATGAVLAWRAEDRLVDATMFLSHCRNGMPPAVELEVEGEVEVRNRREGSGMVVSFPSSIGPMRLKVVAVCPRQCVPPSPGEKWRCRGWLSSNRKTTMPSGRFARRTLWIGDGMEFERVAEAGRFSAAALAAKCGRRLARNATMGLSRAPEIAAMNRAILLGRREDFPRMRRHSFAVAGTVHVFAISGLHVMMVAGLVKRLLNKVVPSSRVIWAACIVAAPCYAVLTGMSPSAVRAAAMAVLWMAAPLLGRRPDSLAALSVTAIGVYAMHPERMFDVGCNLSFAVIFGIVVCARWTKHNGFKFGRAFVSTAAWAAGVPIAAHAFGRLAIGSLVANVVVVVAASMAVAIGFMGMAAGFVSPVLAAFFNGAAAGLTWAMAWISESLAGIPWLSRAVRPWTALECAAWYGFWVLAMMFAENNRNRNRARWQSGLRSAFAD